MDTITHAIVGACVARATAPAAASPASLSVAQRTAIGALAAAFPDIDYITVLGDPLAFIAEWHRSYTHSLVMLPLWAITLGLVLTWSTEARRHRREAVLVCGLSLISHVLTDSITSWKTQIFAPLSHYWVAWGVTFVIDPYFTAIIGLALVVAYARQSRRAARVGIAALVAYVGMQAVLKHQAYDIGEAYAADRGWQDARVHALPQPLSPFNWKIVVAHGAQFDVALVDLLRSEPPPAAGHGIPIFRLQRYYRPQDALQWSTYAQVDAQPLTAAAWRQPQFALYRRFSVLPYVYGVSNDEGRRCAWFADLRFVLPELSVPFRYGMCQQEASSPWRVFRLTGDPRDPAAHEPLDN